MGVPTIKNVPAGGTIVIYCICASTYVLILHCALSLKYSYQYNLEQLKHNFHIFLNYFCFQCKILSMQTAAAAAANTNKHSSKISYLISIARAYLTKIVTAAKIQFNFITDN